MNPSLFPRIRFTQLAGGVLLLFMFATSSRAQTVTAKAWSLLEAGAAEKNTEQRETAVRTLGVISKNPRATGLAKNALNDANPQVRAAAAAALGQMHATNAAPELKKALDDKEVRVVLAAAHALSLLNDPACYEIYYEILTGERKGNTKFMEQQKEMLHDPKQVASLGFNEGIGFLPFAGDGWGALQMIMKDRRDDAAAKAAIIFALANDPEAHTGDALVASSQDKNWVIRVAALEAISKRGDAALLPKIEGLLDDPKYEVRYTAAAVVVHLGPKPAASVPAKTN
jgi:HEAT repeat protein